MDSNRNNFMQKLNFFLKQFQYWLRCFLLQYLFLETIEPSGYQDILKSFIQTFGESSEVSSLN